MLPDDVLSQALAALGLAQVLVNLVRMGFKPADPPSWLSPLLAIVFGIGLCLLLMVATGAVMDAPHIAAAVLAGILAGGGAVGATDLSRRAT